jgi:hypothetical protein
MSSFRLLSLFLYNENKRKRNYAIDIPLQALEIENIYALLTYTIWLWMNINLLELITADRTISTSYYQEQESKKCFL